MVQKSCLLVRTKVNLKNISFLYNHLECSEISCFSTWNPPNEVIIQGGNVELAMVPRYSCLFFCQSAIKRMQYIPHPPPPWPQETYGIK
jgi:hypothetical protein